MRLPTIAVADGIKTSHQTEFGGLNHNKGAKDGELWDMKNLTSDYHPLIATRPQRRLYKTLTNPGGLYCWEKLCWVDGTTFYYDGEAKGTVTAGQKEFSALGVYIIIMPDKAYYNTYSGEFGSLESSWEGTSLTFTNGQLYGDEVDANCIEAAGVDWSDYFNPGDAVTISGCTVHPENNKTPIIREISGDKLYFYEYTFVLDGEGITPYTETGTLSIKRTVPDLKYICENENRLWGCDDTTIYASKLGDIFNWNVYDGLDTDSYAVDTGSAGIFTACVSYLGYPIFFKEDHIYKVYGSLPSNFEVMGSATLGVAEGSSKSLAIAGEILFYLSRSGIMAYSGGIPQPVSENFGVERFKNAAAGSDGMKYYVSMESDGYKLYVYDVQKGLWHIEDGTHATHFAMYDGNIYFLNDEGEIWISGNIQDPPEGTTLEPSVEWMAEFTDYTDDDPYKKGIAKILVRVELDAGATMDTYMKFDSQDWIKVNGTLTTNVKRSYYLPIIPRRADHYRIKFQGTGNCWIYSVAREYYNGSALKSLPGRN